MYKLCAFADESSSAMAGQIAALKRNDIPYLEIRGVDGENIKDISLDKAKEAGWLHVVEGNLDYCPDCRKDVNK